MKSKVLVNLVLVLLLTGLVLYAFFRPKEQSDPGIRLTQLKRDDITRITVERRGSPTIQLEKRDGGWRISAPLQTRADPIQVERLADLIRGKQVEAALTILRFTPKKAARILDKTLRAAIANAADTQNVNPDALYVKYTYVDGGMTWKRFVPRAHGRATPIRKRTSHFTVIVDEKQ